MQRMLFENTWMSERVNERDSPEMICAVKHFKPEWFWVERNRSHLLCGRCQSLVLVLPLLVWIQSCRWGLWWAQQAEVPANRSIERVIDEYVKYSMIFFTKCHFENLPNACENYNSTGQAPMNGPDSYSLQCRDQLSYRSQWLPIQT